MIWFAIEEERALLVRKKKVRLGKASFLGRSEDQKMQLYLRSQLKNQDAPVPEILS